MITPQPPRRFRLDVETDNNRRNSERGYVYGCFWPEWNGGFVIVTWHPESFGLVAYSSIDALQKSPEYREVTSLVWLD